MLSGMKKAILTVVTVVMLAVPALVEAKAVHYFKCADCHRSGLGLTDLGNNVCLLCHSVGSSGRTDNDGLPIDAQGRFSSDDASDAMGTHPGAPLAQTSHYWASMTEVVAAAGATTPTTYATVLDGRYKLSRGKVICSRCHDPHQDATLNPKLLKVTNDADQLCKDCHKPWDVANANAALTHPVGPTTLYSSFAADARFKPAVDNSLTAKGDVRLVNGAVSCTSCHGAHFTDSDAATDDGKAQSKVGNPGYTTGLNNGDGKMLRSDGALVTGATQSETAQKRSNLCQACHTYKTHGNATSPIGCLDCHSGHSYNGGIPNYFVLRDQTTTTTFGPVDTLRYLDPTTTHGGTKAVAAVWAGEAAGDSAGYCERCHGQLTAMAGSLRQHAEGEDCRACHEHNKTGTTFSFEATGCDGCHGYPPRTLTQGGPDGYAFDAGNSYDYSAQAFYKPENATPHKAHAGGGSDYGFGCATCHANNNHDTGTFQDVFLAPINSLASGNGNLSPTYSGGVDGTCASVYCHSNGGKRTGDATRTYTAATIPVWKDGSTTGAITTCDACHGNTAATMSGKNSDRHQLHLGAGPQGKSFGCKDCHVSTAATDTALAAGAIGGSHVSGSVNVAFDTSGFITVGATPYTAATGVCAVYCHSDGNGAFSAPDWDSAPTGKCNICHGGKLSDGAGYIATGSHTKHVSDSGGPQLACSGCHGAGADTATHAGHLNGTKDAPAQAICNSCHGIDGAESAPVWGAPASISCETCHSGTALSTVNTTAPDKSAALSSGHNKASGNYAGSNNAAAAKLCTDCHDANAAGHFDGDLLDKRLAGGFDCGSCHGVIVTHQGKTCSACHDPHGSTNIYMVRSSSADFSGTVVFTSTGGAGFESNSYDEPDAANGDDICATCHSYGGGTLTTHNNQTNEGVAHNEGSDCFTCHKPHTDAAPFSMGAGTACNDCHGYPPVTGAHGDGGVGAIHGKVVTPLAVENPATEDRSDCAFCHTGAELYTYDPSADRVAGRNHGDVAGRVTILTATVGYNSGNGTCSAACHASTAAVDGFWSDANGLNCNACHANPPAGNNHGKHIAAGLACADCHGSVDVPGAGPLNHKHAKDVTTDALWLQTQGQGYLNPNGTDVNVDDSAFNASVNSFVNSAVTNDAGNTCANSGCHNPSGTAFKADWDVDTASCTLCHSGTDPATGSHTPHLAASVATTFKKTVVCADCHGTLPVANSHRSGTVDLAAGIVFAGNSCTTTTCHNDGTGAATATPAWGRVPSDTDNCTICHNEPPNVSGGGSHGEHVAAGYSCGNCHEAAVAGTTAPAQHLDGNVDVYDVVAGDLGYPQNVALGTATWTSCSAAACHNSAQSGDADAGTTAGTTVVTPVWGNAAAVCGSCHANPPTSAKHDEHLGTYGATCVDCHQGAGTGATMPSANHLDGNIDVLASLNYSKYVAGGMPAGDGWGTCTNPNAGCHGTPEARPWDASASSCNSCHGASGVSGAPLIGTDMISTLPLGQHNTHVVTKGYSCNVCHNGHGMPAIDDKITIAFTGMAAGGSYNPPAVWTVGKWLYNQTSTTGTQDCSNLYCHSSGQADGGLGAPSYATADWGSAASGACGTCHSATDPATGSHTAHINDGATCVTCHSGNVHVDQNIDVSVGAYTSAGAPGNGYGTCSTASCHDNGTGAIVITPTWGNASACAECHAAAPATGGHTVHLGATVAGAAIACGDCHSGTVQGSTAGAGHRDGNIDAVGYDTPNKAKATPYTTCSTAACHQSGQAAGAYVTTPVWDANTANCSQCHAASPASGSHTKHIAAAGDCATCHTGAVKDTSYSGAAHGDLNVDVAVGGYTANKALGSAFQSCSSISCHSDGLSGTPGNTPVWGNTAGCAACHASNMTTGSHSVHLAESNLCGNCHAGAVKDTTPPTQHTDGNVDVYVTAPGDLGYTQNAAIGSGSWSTCNAASCHDQGRGGLATTPVWGITVSDCSECHATVPATGSHSAHVTAGSLCGDCHGGAVQGTTPPTAGHRDSNIDTVVGLGYTQNKAKDSAFTTCATASCHNDGRNAGLTGTWGTTLNSCSECHATVPATGSHNAHVTAGALCGDCHSGAVQGTTAPAQHRDSNIDTVAGLGYTQNKTLGGAFTTCATASCHNDGRNAGLTQTWGNTVNNCAECHATSPATFAHQKHLTSTIYKGIAITCGDCHSGAVQGTTAPAGHRDGNIDTVVTYGYTQNKALGSATASCATSYCHGDAMPRGTATGTTNAPNWSATSTGCTFCHDMAPLSIAAHVGKGLTDCITCHGHVNAAGTGFTDPSLHMNGALDGGGDACSDCHSGALSATHAKHVDQASFFTGKLVSNGDNGNAATGWYATTYVSGAPKFGCGQCHPGEGTSHPTAGLNVDIDPAGEGTIPGGNVKLKNAAQSFGTFVSGSNVTCQSVYCHSDGQAAASYKLTPNWYGGAFAGDTCANCHLNQPNTNAHSVHAVGIHYDDLYSGTTGKLTASGAVGVNAGHGDPAQATTINCNICHNATVTVAYNDKNTACASCHTGTPKGTMVVDTASTTHLNGARDVSFASMATFKSKAQIRDNIATVAELNSYWTRSGGGYKAGTTSYDTAKGTPSWNGTSCSTVACHNGNSIQWTAPTGDCTKCHTTLP